MMNYREETMKIPVEDRPISRKDVSGLSNFFGIYGGEHIAATEFVIGATAAIMLNQSLLVLDSGAVTSAVLGSTGLYRTFSRNYSRLDNGESQYLPGEPGI